MKKIQRHMRTFFGEWAREDESDFHALLAVAPGEDPTSSLPKLIGD